MDALPRTNVDASFAHDAFALIDMNKLLWLHCLGEIRGVNFYELILVRPFRHWRVGVGLCHFESDLTHQWSAV